MNRQCLFVLCLLLCICPVSAEDVGTHTASDVTDLSISYDSDVVISFIAIQHIDPDQVGNVSIDSDTFSFSASITTSTLKATADYDFEDKVSGNMTNGSASWWIVPFACLHFGFGNPAECTLDEWIYGSVVSGGTSTWADSLADDPVYPAANFTVVSDGPVDLYWVVLDPDDLESTFIEVLGGELATLIRSIPYIGEHVLDILLIVKFIISAFIVFSSVCITNWSFFLVLFETMVFFHATSILQKKERSKSSEAITASFMAIGSDNKMLLDFLVNLFTKIIDMFTGAVRMFRG